MIAIVSAVADEPRDALVTTSMLNANVDAQCDKLAAVEVKLSYYTCDDGHAVQNSATFGAKFPRKPWKQLILDIPEFPDNKVSRGGYTYCAEMQIDRTPTCDRQSRDRHVASSTLRCRLPSRE